METMTDDYICSIPWYCDASEVLIRIHGPRGGTGEQVIAFMEALGEVEKLYCEMERIPKDRS